MEFARFERSLKTPFRNGAGSHHSRCGFYFREKFADDYRFGEAAPLPGFSHETYEDIEKFLQTSSAREILLSGKPPIASLQFAMDSLRLAPSTVQTVNFSAVVSLDTVEKMLANIALLAEKGFRCFKLKIGPNALSSLRELFLALDRLQIPNCRLRLDANDSLSQSELLSLKELLPENVEYVEGAGKDWNSLPFPVAVDSDTSCFSVSAKNLRAFVAKPTVLGGLQKTKALAEQCATRGMALVLSSSLETEVGLLALRNFSLQLSAPAIPHGLSTAEIFTENFLANEPSQKQYAKMPDALRHWLNSLDWRAL